MFIPESLLFEGLGVLSVIEILENILESSIVLFQDGVLGGQVEWVFSVDGIVETLVGEFSD